MLVLIQLHMLQRGGTNPEIVCRKILGFEMSMMCEMKAISNTCIGKESPFPNSLVPWKLLK